MQKITPVDIQHKTFKKALQGYDRTDVDQFLDDIIEVLEDDANQHAALESEIADLKERISHFKAMEESLQNTLVLAQRTADEVKASAHKEADLIKEQARISAEKEVAHYNTAISDVRREHQRTTETSEKAKSELRSLLMTHLSLLEKTNPVLSPSQFVTRDDEGGAMQESLLVEAAADSKTVDPPGAGSGDTDRITVY